jgi:hypothetical protein
VIQFVDALCTDDAGHFVKDLGGGTGIHKIAADGTARVFNKDPTGISGWRSSVRWLDLRLSTIARKRHRREIDGNCRGAATDIACNDPVVETAKAIRPYVNTGHR